MTPQNAVIEYTAQEAEELIALLDVAVKAGGLSVASVALKHASILQQAFQPQTPSEAVSETKAKAK